MQEDINYGSVTSKLKLDDNGSQVEITKHYRERKLTQLVTKEYRIRHKVRSQEEEHQRFLDFSQRVKQDKGILKPAFEYDMKKLQGNEQGYFVVERYSRLEPLVPTGDNDSLIEFERKRI